MKTLLTINIGALLIAIYPLPYDFYPGLRVLVCGSALYLLFQIYSKQIPKTDGWVILFVGMAILYNPIFPVFLPKIVWGVINLITAYIFYENLQLAGHQGSKSDAPLQSGMTKTDTDLRTFPKQDTTEDGSQSHDEQTEEPVPTYSDEECLQAMKDWENEKIEMIKEEEEYLQFEKDFENELVKKAAKNILGLLYPQHLLMGMQPPNLPSDDFSIGYVFGFVDGYLQSLNISNEDPKAYRIATVVFMGLFGEEHGCILFGRVLGLNADLSSEVVVGSQQGVKDISVFINSSDKGKDGPMGWVCKIKGIVDERYL